MLSKTKRRAPLRPLSVQLGRNSRRNDQREDREQGQAADVLDMLFISREGTVCLMFIYHYYLMGAWHIWIHIWIRISD